MDRNGTPYETSSAFLRARRGKRAKTPEEPQVTAGGRRGYPALRCDITIAPRSERPGNTAEVTRRYILPAILESLEAEAEADPGSPFGGATNAMTISVGQERKEHDDTT
jgi:hypothetical protein